MSDSIPPNKAPGALKPQSIIPMPSPKYPVQDIPSAEKMEGQNNSWKDQQAQGGERTEKDWNTKNLLQRLATDAFSAASAAVMVAPLITIIDK